MILNTSMLLLHHYCCGCIGCWNVMQLLHDLLDSPTPVHSRRYVSLDPRKKLAMGGRFPWTTMRCAQWLHSIEV